MNQNQIQVNYADFSTLNNIYLRIIDLDYAKNIILFIGEDLPVSTFKTARLYQQCLGDFCYDEVPKDSILRYYFQDYAIAKVRNSI